jgi:hypothetical protein
MNPRLRAAVALVAAIATGAFVTTCGFAATRVATNDIHSNWYLLTWSNHWALRAVTSLLAFAAAGFIAGIVGRQHGALLALAATSPAALVWAAYLWNPTGAYISIGYRFVAILVLATGPYVAIKTAGAGETTAGDLRSHFDSRPSVSVLGVRWFHFLWIPIYIYGLSALLAPVLFVFLMSIRTAFRSEMSFLIVIIPVLVALALGFSLQVTASGVEKAYARLAGFSTEGRSVPLNLIAGPAVVLAADVILFWLRTLGHKG